MTPLTTTQVAVAPRRALAWMLVTVAVTLAAYGPALQTSFVGDDFMILHWLRQAGGLDHPEAYFRLNFFGYFRPVAFLSHALDWEIWGGQAVGFHLTSLLLHAANVALVFVFARRLLNAPAASVASLLFALHPSNHEAVFWISSRFDLLATFLMLVGLVCVQSADLDRFSARRAAWLRVAALACFFLALLSKESAFAYPIVAVAYDVLIARRTGRSTLLRLLPLIGVVGAYSVVRAQAGGPEVAEGLSHLGKIAALGGALAALVSLAFADTDAFFAKLAARRNRVLAALAVPLAAVLVAALLPGTATFVRPKLAFAAFAAFYLLSPIITWGGSAPLTFDPNETLYWLTGWSALAAAATLTALVWARGGARRDESARTRNRQVAFLLVFVAGALLPVSSMTEGARYLYVASIGISMSAGYAFVSIGSSRRRAVIAVLLAVLVACVWQLQLKATDWKWSSAMTADTVELVRRAEPDPCASRNILFLAAPVNIRAVYCHFYDYTFEEPATGCRPRVVRALVRVVGDDETFRAAWDQRSVVMTRTGENRRLLASTDLRHFDVLLRADTARNVPTPIGTLRARPAGTGQRLELELPDDFDPARWRFLYYSAGRVHELLAAPSTPR